jgi:hypothetical protein
VVPDGHPFGHGRSAHGLSVGAAPNRFFRKFFGVIVRSIERLFVTGLRRLLSLLPDFSQQFLRRAQMKLNKSPVGFCWRARDEFME